MSEENIQIVRRLYDWVDWHGWSAAFAAPELHPDCELTFMVGPQAGTHRGAAQIEAVLADLQAGFERVGSPSRWKSWTARSGGCHP